MFENLNVNTIITEPTSKPTFDDDHIKIDSNEYEWDSYDSNEYNLDTLWSFEKTNVPNLATTFISFVDTNDKISLHYQQLIDWDQQHHTPVLDTF